MRRGIIWRRPDTTTMRTEELDFDLPAGMIATRPAEPRDSARLLVVSRTDPSRMEHLRVSDLAGLLTAEDTLVYNTTRVLPARLVGHRADTGGRVEGLYLHAGADDPEHVDPMGRGDSDCVVLLRGRRLRAGSEVVLHDAEGRETDIRLALQGKDEAEGGGAWRVRVSAPDDLLSRAGLTPLPPYILNARAAGGLDEGVTDGFDRVRYQTVYAGTDGSVAAPTAGLHFTPGLLEALASRGVGRAEVVLHVGIGTFRPVEADRLEDHDMHAEWCRLGEGAAALLRDRVGGAGVSGPDGGLGDARVIAVGTTSARTLESFAAVEDPTGWIRTRLLIAPGYEWRVTDGLLTNFHLPRSTLLAMVGALFPGGVGRVLEIYREAMAAGYRFYSYGDAMLVLP
jgi:S-adenosylmethionine:tRNA ribosyltransferase-isomerase